MKGLGLLSIYVVILIIDVFLAIWSVKTHNTKIFYVFGFLSLIISLSKYVYYDTHPVIEGSHFELCGFDEWTWSYGASIIYLSIIVGFTILRIFILKKRR